MKQLSIIICILFSFNAKADTIFVGKKYSVASIQLAIHQAKENDVIIVAAGKYFEKNLIVDKPLTIKGIQHPVLDGEHKYEVVSIKSPYVNFDGFTIKNSGISSIIDYAGIKIYNTHHVTISNNIVEDAFFGIYSQYGSNCTISNNIINAHQLEEQQSGNGIHCWKSDSMRIIGNAVSGHRDGIYFEFVTNSVIWRNTSTRNIRYGLHFMFSNDDSYISNIFESNGAGVAVMFSHGVRMFSNFFKENWGDAAYGILLKEISDSHIQGNHFESNTIGIYIEGASRIEMTKNNFYNNGWALKIQASCMDIHLHHNNFIGNTFDVGTNGSLVLNTFNNNYWDKYEGYDLNKDKIGDVPYRPVSMYSMIIERTPPAIMLFRSFITALMDKTEKVIPSLTPENLIDDKPLMKPLPL